MKFSIICGNDKRYNTVKEKMIKAGYEMTAIEEADIAILPVPLTKDHENITGTNIKVKDILLMAVKYNIKLFAGNISNEILNEAYKLDVYCVDYMDEAAIMANARLTAKGIYDIARRKKAFTRNGYTLVAGFGRCGKCITDILVRNRITPIILPRFISENDHKLYDLLKRVDTVFNTVPKLIFDSEMIDRFNMDVQIYDISSAPGGVDLPYCKSKKIFADIYPGIPGKMYPEQAGEIIYQSINNSLVHRKK